MRENTFQKLIKLHFEELSIPQKLQFLRWALTSTETHITAVASYSTKTIENSEAQAKSMDKKLSP